MTLLSRCAVDRMVVGGNKRRDEEEVNKPTKMNSSIKITTDRRGGDLRFYVSPASGHFNFSPNLAHNFFGKNFNS